MAGTVGDVMTRNPQTVDPTAAITEPAQRMRDADTGAIVVTDGREVRGILTDRDIVVRAVADGRDPNAARVQDVYTPDPTTVSSGDSLEDAARTMREHEVRRLPVTEGRRLVGVVSLGDLAIELDEDSALADISAARQNN